MRRHLLHVLHLSSLCFAAGCISGPNYGGGQFYPGHASAWVSLERYSVLNGWAKERFDQTNFLAPAKLIPTAGAGGTIQPGRAFRVNNDDPEHRSAFFPIRGSSKWIRLTTGPTGVTEVHVFGERHPSGSFVTSFKNHEGDSSTSGFALTRSGKYLLVVREQRTDVWDLETLRLLHSKPNGTLNEVRTALAFNRGSAGKWWLSEDLRFVVIEPSDYVETPGGSSRREDEIMNARIDGIMVDINHQGVIYDQSTRTVATFPAERDRARVVDAQNVNGTLSLIYAGRAGDGMRITAMDTTGRKLFEHTFASTSVHETTIADWEPADSEIWLFNGAPEQSPMAEPPNGYSATRWNYRSGQISTYTLPFRVIERAINASRQ